MSKKLVILFLAVLFTFTYSAPAKALEGTWVVTDHLQGRLITGVDSTANLAFFDALFDLQLGEGWHTYWRNPGDAGLPPRFDWSASENVERVDILWPAPVRKLELDFNTFGYENNVGFPLTVHIKEPGKSVSLKLKADVMVCSDICIPQTLNLALEVPSGESAAAAQIALIEAARKQLPGLDNTHDLKIEGVIAGPDAIVVTAYSEKGFEGIDVFTTIADTAFTSPPVIAPLTGEDNKALITIAKPQGVENLPAFLTGK